MDLLDIEIHLTDDNLRWKEDISWWMSAVEYLMAEVKRIKEENAKLLVEAYWNEVEKRSRDRTR